MADQRPVVNLIIFLFIMMMIVKVTHGADTCYNGLDLVIAVDTTSSQSTSSFDALKAEVKGIVSTFTVGQDKTRLALISMSRTANVVANFNGVNSLSDFNAAVDRLTFSTDLVDLSEGIKVAKDSVLNTARAYNISKVLILVKDMRSGSAAVSDTSVLSRVTSEAAAVKSIGAAISAVGVGGLWNRVELMALFGPDYLLFFNKNKVFESVKSLNHELCDEACPDKGKSSDKAGLCYKSGKQTLKSVVGSKRLPSGWTKCRKQITREFSSCSGKQSCTSMDRKISACNSAGKVAIENIWQSFDSKLQSCVTTTDVQTVDCRDSMKCIGQVAEVIFVLDKSGSMGYQFTEVKDATILLINALNVGRHNVRVGVLIFSTRVETNHALESTTNKQDLLDSVNRMSTRSSGGTATDLALDEARKSFDSHGRSGVPRFVFVFTDGASAAPDLTFTSSSAIKNSGVTMYVIGIGRNLNRPEIETMTAPSSDTNAIFVNTFDELKTWTQTFSKRICIELSPPNPKLCEDSVFSTSISDCVGGKQQVTKTEYKYDAARKCVKSIQSTISASCRAKCTDPINGNEYFHGDTWTNLCHEFLCSSANPLVPQRSKCFAADGSCKDVGSAPFTCRDEKGVEKSSCECVLKNGKVTLVV